jgi:hypothetical protein
LFGLYERVFPLENKEYYLFNIDQLLKTISDREDVFLSIHDLFMTVTNQKYRKSELEKMSEKNLSELYGKLCTLYLFHHQNDIQRKSIVESEMNEQIAKKNKVIRTLEKELKETKEFFESIQKFDLSDKDSKVAEMLHWHNSLEDFLPEVITDLEEEDEIIIHGHIMTLDIVKGEELYTPKIKLLINESPVHFEEEYSMTSFYCDNVFVEIKEIDLVNDYLYLSLTKK